MFTRMIKKILSIETKTYDDYIYLFPSVVLIVSHFFINVGYTDLNIKNNLIFFFSFFSFLYSIYLFIFGRNSEEKMNIISRIKLLLPYLTIFFIVYFLVEIVNFSDFYSLRIPIFVLFNVIFVVVVLNITITKSNIYKFIYVLSLVNIIILIYASILSIIIRVLPNEIIFYDDKVFQHTKFILGIGLRQQRYKSSNRFFSIFSNPSHYGEMGFISILFLSLYRKNKQLSYDIALNKRIYILGLISVIISIINSKTRTAFLSIILYCFSMLLLYLKDNNSVSEILKKKTVKIIISITSIMIFSFTFYFFKSRGGFNNNGRFQLFNYAIILFKEKPIFGHGTKRFYELISAKYDNAHAHNSYLQLLGSGGVLFLFIYLYIYYYSLKRLLEMDNSIKIRNNVFVFVIITMIYQLFDNKVLAIHYQFQILLTIVVLLKITE